MFANLELSIVAGAFCVRLALLLGKMKVVKSAASFKLHNAEGHSDPGAKLRSRLVVTMLGTQKGHET